jgi:DNA repair exonuclease SbcCD ATPase subunit
MDLQCKVRVTNIEGFDDHPLKIILLDLGQPLLEQDGLTTKEVVVKGRLQVIVKNLNSMILGSLSIDVNTLPQEGNFWLPLACSEEDLIEQIPEECQIPCVMLEINPSKKPKHTQDTLKPSADLRKRVQSLEQALKTEKWRGQELTDNCRSQLQAASFKTDKLQALLKKSSDKVAELEARLLADKTKAALRHSEMEKRAAQLTGELEASNARLNRHFEEGLSKDEEISSLMTSLAELAKRVADEQQEQQLFETKLQLKEAQAKGRLLQEQCEQLHRQVTSLQATFKDTLSVEEYNTKLAVLEEDLTLSRLMIKEQQKELHKERTKAATEGEEAQAKINDLLKCVKELAKQNQVLSGELSNVLKTSQAELQDKRSQMTQTSNQHDFVAEQEFKEFLKLRHLEHKVKDIEGQFIIRDANIRPFRRGSELLVTIEGNLHFLESLMHSPENGHSELIRRRSMTPTRDPRISHRKFSSQSNIDTNFLNKSETTFESSFELRQIVSQSKASKENKRERPSYERPTKQMELSWSSQLASKATHKNGVKRQVAPFK